MLSEFVEYAWTHGLTRAYAGNALSASLRAFPELKGHLHEPWYLLKAWSAIELPTRAAPLPVLAVPAFIWYSVERKDYACAFLIAIGYDAFLRTGALMNMCMKDISYDQAGKTGVVSLRDIKVGQRAGSFEALPIHDPLVYRLWVLLKQNVPPQSAPEHCVYPLPPQRFADRFKEAVKALGLEGAGMRPYSLRRGGATAFFRATANLARTLERGRWVSVKTGRLYVCDGLGREAELRIPSAQRSQ